MFFYWISKNIEKHRIFKISLKNIEYHRKTMDFVENNAMVFEKTSKNIEFLEIYFEKHWISKKNIEIHIKTLDFEEKQWIL